MKGKKKEQNSGQEREDEVVGSENKKMYLENTEGDRRQEKNLGSLNKKGCLDWQYFKCINLSASRNNSWYSISFNILYIIQALHLLSLIPQVISCFLPKSQ